MQLTHYNTTFKKCLFPIILVCDNVSKAPNVGSLFRTADAFGIEKIIFCGAPIPKGRHMTKIARSTDRFVDFEECLDCFEVVNSLKNKAYNIIGVEITTNSQSLYNYKFLNTPIALVVGDENFGISERVLNLCDDIVHIDMFGKNSSMNVVQATNVALYEITKQLMLKSQKTNIFTR